MQGTDTMKITNFKDIPQFTQEGNYHADYPLHRFGNYIKNEIEEMGLQLNPDFQRGHVWTEEQQIAWLEYFMRGGKSGTTIYLNYPNWNLVGKRYKVPYDDYVCVDGLQRITAVQRFLNNEIPVFGTYYKDFEDQPRFIKNSLHIVVNDLKTKKEVLTWYVEMNSGGTPHSKKEINRIQDMIKELDEKEMENDEYER